MTTPSSNFKRRELKLVVTAEEAARVRSYADARFAPDVYAGGKATYLVHSLYLDSPSLDVYHRALGTEGVKYRVRRYGVEEVVWFEKKRRRGDVVTKRRGPFPFAELPAFLDGSKRVVEWPLEFRRAIERFRLEPKVLVTYPRSAWTAAPGARVTLDWGVDARRPDGADYFSTTAPPADVGRDVVLELKFDGERPPQFDAILSEVGRDPGPFSKYGRSVEAIGLVVGGSKAPIVPTDSTSAPKG